jgi:hypothetical protein
MAHTNGMVSRMIVRNGAPEIAEIMNGNHPKMYQIDAQALRGRNENRQDDENDGAAFE